MKCSFIIKPHRRDEKNSSDNKNNNIQASYKTISLCSIYLSTFYIFLSTFYIFLSTFALSNYLSIFSISSLFISFIYAKEITYKHITKHDIYLSIHMFLSVYIYVSFYLNLIIHLLFYFFYILLYWIFNYLFLSITY